MGFHEKDRKKKWVFIPLLVISLFILGVMAFVAILYQDVSREAMTLIRDGAIRNIIFSESPVYYDDGENVIGVFFEKVHRKYIRYNDIPPLFIKALIASEDQHFFNHSGFDIRSIIRAFFANIRAGRVVQGGSTITQQTAKNIFKRERRSYRAKLKELIQALILEKNFSKEDILEMYINQFFVTGFGSGLRIAAQYFFNKEAESLDLVESAFIAGSVKGPFRYNPFTKKTEAEKSEARRAAKKRKDYVLGNMLKMNFITQDQYREAVNREVPFKEGKVTYRLNVVLDYIRDQLESEYFRTVLRQQGIENIATSGIKIYTSLNRTMQEKGLQSIRKHLPYFDVELNGYGSEHFQEVYRKMAGKALEKRDNGLPFLCRITEINSNPENPVLMVAWDNGGGIIDYDGLKNMGEAWLKGRLGRWAEFDRRHGPDLLKNFKIGDLIPVHLIPSSSDPNQKVLALSQFPELEGGIIVLKKGMIKAMIGGFFDKFFNRAVDAKRQLGSIFKPLVYTAALQLKWNSLDPLMNVRDLFRFETTAYLPRPDHHPESEKVSMLWAGVKSENLATVWLLYHLTDRLNPSEFQQVAARVGLNRGEDESYNEYAERIRDTYGVIVDREALLEAAFEESKKDVKADLIFSGQDEALTNLQRLHFDIDPKTLNFQTVDAAKIRRFSFKSLILSNFEMMRSLKLIKDRAVSDRGATEDDVIGAFYFMQREDGANRLIYTKTPRLIDAQNLRPATVDEMLDPSNNISGGDIWIEGLLPSSAIGLVQSNISEIYKGFLSHKRYEPEILSKIRDFKTLVNMYYVKDLAEKMGIDTRLDPVLSFPLGASAISIIEAAQAYQTMMTGNVYPLDRFPASGMVPLITKIVDRDGALVWEYRPRPRTLLTKMTSLSISEILRTVMEQGTGRQAQGKVQLNLDFENGLISFPITTYGKTGTANQFTNSSFAGFIPGIHRDSGLFDIEEGYTIASYVGYDDNRPMKGKRISIYGASGALPLWIDMANAIVNAQKYKKEIQVADLTFESGQILPAGHEHFMKVAVSPRTGLPLWPFDKKEQGETPKVFGRLEIKNKELVLRRSFELLPGDDKDEEF